MSLAQLVGSGVGLSPVLRLVLESRSVHPGTGSYGRWQPRQMGWLACCSGIQGLDDLTVAARPLPLVLN